MERDFIFPLPSFHPLFKGFWASFFLSSRCEIPLWLLLRYVRLGLTFSPTSTTSTFLVTHSYKLQPLNSPKWPPYWFSSPPAVELSAPVCSDREQSIKELGLKKKKKKGVPVVFNPLYCLKEVIKSLQHCVTSRWQRRGERLHSPWCPSTPGTDPSGSAGHARHSRSAPAPHRTWWHTEGIRAKTQMWRNSCCVNLGALPKQYLPLPPPAKY